jgi:hypothetical protein
MQQLPYKNAGNYKEHKQIIDATTTLQKRW